MADLLRGPTIANLPLWYGEDTLFVIRRHTLDAEGNSIPVNYDTGTTARIIIDQKGTDITAEAIIVDDVARFQLLATQTDAVKKDTLWRIQFTFPTVGNKVPLAGKVVRKGE